MHIKKIRAKKAGLQQKYEQGFSQTKKHTKYSEEYIAK